MKLLILEDDPLIGEDLKQIAEDQPGIHAQLVTDQNAFMSLFKQDEIDAALLDIRIENEELGIECAELLSEAQKPFCFITSYSDRDILKRAIGTQPTGYLLKPFTTREVIEELNKLQSHVNQKSIVFLSFGKHVPINRSEIMYLMSENVYVNIFSSGKKTVFRGKMEEVISKVNIPNLIRVHRSYAVNLKYVQSLSDKIILFDGTEIPVSRKYRSSVVEQLQDLS